MRAFLAVLIAFSGIPLTFVFLDNHIVRSTGVIAFSLTGLGTLLLLLPWLIGRDQIVLGSQYLNGLFL